MSVRKSLFWTWKKAREGGKEKLTSRPPPSLVSIKKGKPTDNKTLNVSKRKKCVDKKIMKKEKHSQF